MLTKLGCSTLLKAFQGLNPGPLYLALVSGLPAADPDMTSFDEPSIGVNGYNRILLDDNLTDWPTLSELNNEQFLESKQVTWTATGAGFIQPVTRVILVNHETALTGKIILGVGAAFPELVIGPSTPSIDRSFKFRIYLR